MVQCVCVCVCAVLLCSIIFLSDTKLTPQFDSAVNGQLQCLREVCSSWIIDELLMMSHSSTLNKVVCFFPTIFCFVDKTMNE